MLMPLISMGSTYLLIKVGFLPYLNGVYIPWTTPPIISGLLVGGWKMMIWQAIVLVLSFFVYWPFAHKQDQILYGQEQAAVDSEVHTKEAEAAATTEHATD